MTDKGKKELVRRETPSYLTPFEQMEKWSEEMWRRPSSLLAPSIWPDMKVAEGYEISPSVDMYDEENEVVLKADLPGIKKKDLDINLTENVLTISGEKKKEEKIERENYYRYERSHGSFCRKFQLPADIDREKVKAHFEDGVLEVRLPKTEEAKKHTRKISIT